MRIAINTRFLLKDKLEGIGWFTHEVCRRLVDRHPDWEFVFLFDRPFDPSFVYADNVTPKVVFPPARRDFLWKIWFEWSVPRVLKRKKIDVFFSPDNYLSLKTDVPTVMVCHDLAFLHFPEGIPDWALRFYQKYTPLYLAKADQIVTVSQFVKQDIVAQYNIDAAKIDVACNGARSIFQPLSGNERSAAVARFGEGHPYFAYLGAIHPRKNVHRLIAAFDAFKTKTGAPHKLILGGRFAWQTGPVKAAFDLAKAKDDIVFTGYLAEADLPLLIGGASAFVYWSHSEGFGIPVLEAMHTDTPIITSTESSLPEIAGAAALLIAPDDTDSMVTALEELSKNEVLRQQLITQGRQQRLNFTWEQAVDVVEAAILRASEKH